MCRSPPTKEATTSLWAGPSAHGRGIQADVRRRRPWYVSDWTDGWNASYSSLSVCPSLSLAQAQANYVAGSPVPLPLPPGPPVRLD